MANSIYLTGFPGPAGMLDVPLLGQFPVDIGADAVDIHAGRGLGYLLRAVVPDPAMAVELSGPPFPAGFAPFDDAFSVAWPGARRTIYPATSFGRSTAPDDLPADLHVHGGLDAGAAVNYAVTLFDGIEPSLSAKGGQGVIKLVDPNGELDWLTDFAWDGAALDILRGDPSGPFRDFVPVARLTTAGILYGPRHKELRLTDLGWQLQQAGLHDDIYGGAGGADGDAGLKGVYRPLAFGPVFNVEPPLVNAAPAIHQLSCSSVLSVDAVRDGGVALGFSGDYPTYEALAAATVPPGTYATCLAGGWLRRGSPIVKALTCDFRGDNDVINDQPYPHTRGQIARRIATGRGTIRLRDVDMDYAALTRLEQVQTAPVGFYFGGGQQISKAVALARVMAGCMGWWVVRLSGLLAVGAVDEPVGTAALTLNWPEDFAGEPTQLSTYQTPRRATYVSWKTNYTEQDPSRLAGESIDAGEGLIYGQPARYAGTDNSFQSWLWPTAGTIRVEDSGFADETDAYNEALRQWNAMGVRRERWSVPTPCDPYSDLLGRVVQVNGFPRYGWGSARKFLCVGQSFASGRKTVLDLWG